MTFSLLSLAIFGITAAIIYKNARKGYKHGLSRSLIRLATLLFCAVFSSVLSVWLAKLCGDLIFPTVLRLRWLKILSVKLTMLQEVVHLLLNMLLSLIFYLPLFYLMRLLVSCLFRLITKIAMGKAGARAKKIVYYLSEDAPYYVRSDRSWGAVVGVLSGLIVSIVVFMPLTGLLKTGQSVADVLENMDEIPAVTKIEESKGMKLLDRYADDASSTILYSCGGKVLYNLTVRTSMYGQTTYLNKEIDTIKAIDVWEIKEEMQDSTTITAQNAQMLEDALDDAQPSLALKLLMTDVVQEASEKWLGHEAYFGVERPSLGKYEAMDDFLDTILYICSTTSVETCDADMRTVINIIELMYDYPVLFDNNDYVTFIREFAESDAIQRLEEELSKNPRMDKAYLVVDDLMMNVIAREVQKNKYTPEQRSRLYRGLADALRDSQHLGGSVKTLAISRSVSEQFSTYGLYLPEQLEERVARSLSENIAVDDTLSEREIEEYFSQIAKPAKNY